MILSELNLNNYRNYSQLHIAFNEGVQIIHGKNGHGKTNLLEAIYCLALTKSFRPVKDVHLIHDQEQEASLLGVFRSPLKTYRVKNTISVKKYKTIEVNDKKIGRFSSYIGTIPVVLLIPTDLQITKGGPIERRRFMDLVLGQADADYLQNLIQYRQILQFRNKLILEETPDRIYFESLTMQLAQLADQILSRRLDLITWLNNKIPDLYQELSRDQANIVLEYQRKTASAKANASYKDIWPQISGQELVRKKTLMGPHLDDLDILINGKPVRYYGSQGENKTVVISLKLAEYLFLNENKNDFPILLFDDIFGELDRSRINNMLNIMGKVSQVFITTTSADFFGKLHIDVPYRMLEIQNGQMVGETFHA